MKRGGEQEPHPFDPAAGTREPGSAPAPTAAPHATHAGPPHAPRESRMKHAGAMLGGAAAFVAAITTAWVNLRERDAGPAPAPVPHAQPAVQPPAAPPPAVAEEGPIRRRIGIDRILVEHDGSPGTTDWRFEVDLGGERVMAFQQNGLDDSPGLNVAQQQATAVYPVPRKGGVSVTVRGWRLGPMHSSQAPDVTGIGTLGGDGAIAPIPVQGDAPDEGMFVFHFNAKPAE